MEFSNHEKGCINGKNLFESNHSLIKLPTIVFKREAKNRKIEKWKNKTRKRFFLLARGDFE
jgi:hypothetical protein